MAVLTDEDVSKMRDDVYQIGRGKEEIKMAGPCPNHVKFKQVFQAFEDFEDGNVPILKAECDVGGTAMRAILRTRIEAAWGTGLDPALFRKLKRAFERSKERRGG